MKNVVTMIVNVSLGVLLLLIILTVTGRMNRSMEVKSNLSSLTEEIVEHMGNSSGYGSPQMAEAEAVKQLTERVDAAADITVEMEKADVERGLLAMKVTESWKHPNGRTGTVQDCRIVLLNQLEVQEIREVTVTFYLSKEAMENGEKCYKCCYLYEGDNVSPPAVPVKQGALFDGWRDSSDYMADFSVPVQQDIVYYAAWR